MTLVTANIRGFHTNVGELTHRFILKNSADLVFVCETFLDNSVPKTYARVKGYSAWVRKDRSTQGGGVAFCYKTSLNVVVLDTPIPAGLEVILLKVVGAEGRGTLCVGCYRPPSQGTAVLDYLTNNIDSLLTTHHCDNIIIVGDLNPRGVQHAFNSLLDVFDLTNHVTFPTHRSGSILDPVITDLEAHEVKCSPLGPVGTSDHEAILTKISLLRSCDESTSRTIWQWEKADWQGLRCSLALVDWERELQGDVDQQVDFFTEALLKAQSSHVPHKQLTTKGSDQKWFGPQCQAASDAKYKAWRNYKRHPTRRNKQLHREAAAHMEAMQDWARLQWIEDKKRKLRGGNIGSKMWWGLVNDGLGVARDSTIPPLNKRDGSAAISTQEKVNLLAEHFSRKMAVPNPTRRPPSLPVVAGVSLTTFDTTEAEVRAALTELEEAKAVGPDGISPRVLRRCAEVLAPPLALIFRAILHDSKWPRAWKVSHVVPVHKKGSRSVTDNYRPVSLLSVVSKVLEGIIAARLTAHLESQHLLSTRQFGFRKGRSAADLNLLLVSEWSDALDQGRPTAVLALDIAGAFDKVWHVGLVERLRAVGLRGSTLELLENYLQGRHLRVVHNGQQSSPHDIRAGVPQGSVLGPLLWNLYINDLLHLIPSARAYADDVTVSVSYHPGEEASTVTRLNASLRLLERWGHSWQVTFAPHKTQLLVVSRTRQDIQLRFNGAALLPQEEVSILGVTYDSKLTFKSHISQLARTAAGKLTSLRRISWLLDCRGRELLYKAQVRSSLEYSCLAFGGAASSHLAKLDGVQRRAERIIFDHHPEQSGSLQTLRHRRHVAGLTTLYKVQHMHTAHLQQLHQPLHRPEVQTRGVVRAPSALVVPRSHTSHHQRQFIPSYVRMWNTLLSWNKCPENLSVAECGVQRFKVCANEWLSEVTVTPET